jgi:hypothetical protein
MSNGRFDYVKYDKQAADEQSIAKEIVTTLEEFIEGIGKNPDQVNIDIERAKGIALMHLEEVYMWIGKGIRDDQRARTTAALQEERMDS